VDVISSDVEVKTLGGSDAGGANDHVIMAPLKTKAKHPTPIAGGSSIALIMQSPGIGSPPPPAPTELEPHPLQKSEIARLTHSFLPFFLYLSSV